MIPLVHRLLVVIADRLTELARKGELTPRYYNPGNIFDEVHLLLINDDRPDEATIRPLVGRATLHLHNLPAPSFALSLGWRPALLNSWTRRAVALAETIRPDLIRSYGAWLNGLAAVAIGQARHTPVVVSVHSNPDYVREHSSWQEPKSKLFWASSLAVERSVLRRADLVLPVYDAARSYAESLGAQRVTVVYNAVNQDAIAPKTSYALAAPPRIVSVGRQIGGKFPEHLVRACAKLGAHLTLIGQGSHHERLKAAAEACGANAEFITALPNDDVCRTLKDYDIYAAHCAYPGISKTTIEAMLAGLPVVMTRDPGQRMLELEESPCALVPNSLDGFSGGLETLLSDHARRHDMGTRGRAFAQMRFDPERMEATIGTIYRSFLNA